MSSHVKNEVYAKPENNCYELETINNPAYFQSYNGAIFMLAIELRLRTIID